MIMTIAKTILDRISMAWNAPRPSQSPTDPPMADSSFLTEGDLSSVIVTVTSGRPVFAEMYDFSEKLRKGSRGEHFRSKEFHYKFGRTRSFVLNFREKKNCIMFSRKRGGGGGSKAVRSFSENSSILEKTGLSYQRNREEYAAKKGHCLF